MYMRKLRLNRYGKQKLLKILAGITAVCISPLLASTINKNTPDFSLIMNEAAQYMEENITISRNPVPLAMNEVNSALLLYKPAVENGETGVITEKLPPVLDNGGGNSEININGYNEESHDSLAGEISNKENVNSIPESVNVPFNIQKNDEGAVMAQNISGETEDLSVFNSEDGKIVNMTFKPSNGISFINLEKAGQVRNETKLDNNVVFAESLISPDIKLELNGEPEILIIHTHTSEAYQPDNTDYYDNEYNSRSLDPDKNVVAVGGELAKSLASMGITVLHDGTIHDSPEYKGAYARSEQTVQSILAEYPSIKIVLDIHRDAIEDEAGSRISAMTEVEGKNAAQVMIISAADDGTYDIPNYIENFKLASLLQQSMESDYPGITRPVLFQYCHYNQQLSTGSLLIEVGSHGNSLEQAKYTGQLIGKSIGKALLGL